MRKNAAILILFLASLTLWTPYAMGQEWASLEPLSSHADVFNGAGGSTTVKLRANAAWTLASDVPWMTVSASSGRKGRRQFTITTSANTGDTCRTGILTLSAGGDALSLEIRQRPYIFTRQLLAEANVRNAISMRSNGTVFTRIYSVMPVPETNLYQDISNWKSSGRGLLFACPDGVNAYMASDLDEKHIPSHGGEIATETFHVKAYKVTANLSLIQDIPEYDPDSKECRQYLGKEENDYVDPFHPEISELANRLWEESSGDLIAYARTCYEWTAQNLKYGNRHVGMQPIDFVMRYRISDCGNFSSVFISLLRAKGIPARHIVMINPWEKRTESWIRQHTRAEFYIPAYGWIPVDPTYKNGNPYGDFFGVFTGPHVVMYRGITLECKGPDMAEYSLEAGTQTHWWYWYSTVGGMEFSNQFSTY